MYNVGESVVNVDNLRTGNIVSINEDNNTVEVAYGDGTVESVNAESIKKLLLEVDPPRDTPLL
tara:strand:- start:1786 stop:1974 length:189 start_codon:yes stop_codon:yes gene_type:complete